jgi:transposase
MANPALEEVARAYLVGRLMAPRRAVRDAKKRADPNDEAAAHQVKRALGERGPVWRVDGAAISTATWRKISPTRNSMRDCFAPTLEDFELPKAAIFDLAVCGKTPSPWRELDDSLYHLESPETIMRGRFTDQGGLFSYIAPDKRVPANHPLRKVRELVRDVLDELNRSLGKLYSSEGRPSIPPEQLLSALLLQVFYGIRSERQLMEQLDYNLLYRWFVGLSPDDPVWDPTTFTKNRERLQNGDVFTKFMIRLLNHSQVKPLLSDEHFSVDGTLIEAWASQKSFRPKDGSGDDDGGADFHGQKRKNDTHASTSDPDSRLYRKAAGREAKLCYMGHATMENRHGLAVAGRVTHANGTAERRASETMLKARRKAVGRRITAGEDKAYDTAEHVANLRAIGVTPHVTQNQAVTKTGKTRNSAIDKRTTRHPGYGMSQSRRAMVECIFGWGKQHGTMRKTKHRGIARVAADFLLNLIAYNLIRIPKLIAA